MSNSVNPATRDVFPSRELTLVEGSVGASSEGSHEPFLVDSVTSSMDIVLMVPKTQTLAQLAPDNEPLSKDKFLTTPNKFSSLVYDSEDDTLVSSDGEEYLFFRSLPTCGHHVSSKEAKGKASEEKEKEEDSREEE